MAHEMVRQPSQTPNIDNIDDIIPFRYAYGNQDGYVINKGNELSHTINGSEFRINSGRVVLQGVEDDIDANGVTFSIEDIAETRYYVIYYRVNLALNITSYEIDYDTADYPTIDAGDDLTKNSSGSANLPLYRFVASSGVISGVEKVVRAIEYLNVDYVNNLFGTSQPTKFGEYLIKKYKILYNSNNRDQTITLNEAVENGDHLIVEYYTSGGHMSRDIYPIEIGLYEQSFYSDYNGYINADTSFGIWMDTIKLSIDGKTLSLSDYRGVVWGNGSFSYRNTDLTSNLNRDFFYISKVYKIIE